MEKIGTLLALVLALIVFSIIADRAYEQRLLTSRQTVSGHAAEAKMVDPP